MLARVLIILVQNICGVSSSFDSSVVESWFENLKKLVLDYKSKNILNYDETVLFFLEFPDKKLCFKNEICRGSKIEKDH